MSYQPHRVAMQFGYDKDLHRLVISHSNLLRKYVTDCDDYSINIKESFLLYLPSKMTKSEVSICYFNWWRKKVLCLLNKSIHMLQTRRRQPRRRTPTYSHQVPSK